MITGFYDDFDPDSWAEMAMTDMACSSNADCPMDLMLSCGWYEYNYDWSDDFCVPNPVCGEEYEKDGVYVGIYCFEDNRYGNSALRYALSFLSVFAMLYAAI